MPSQKQPTWGQRLLGSVAGKAGKVIDVVGKATNNFGLVTPLKTQLPELKISENLQRIGGMYNPLNPPSAKASDYNPYAGTQSTYDPYRNTQSQPTGQVLGASTGQGFGGGTTGGNTATATTGSQNGSYDPFSNLRSAYDYARSIYESQMPSLEGDYNRVKGDIEGAVARAKETLTESKDNINRGYGESLRNLITNSQELGQKTRNVYSGLNALDSSSYADAQIKQEQAQYDTQGKLEQQKLSDTKEADRQYAEYEAKANENLATLGKQYVAGKQALQQAIADNNIEEANTIMSHMENLSSLMTNAKLGLAQLQAGGTDVIGSLKKLNGSGAGDIFGSYLSNVYNPSMSGFNFAQPSTQGQGYISPKTGRRYGSYQDYLNSEGRTA